MPVVVGTRGWPSAEDCHDRQVQAAVACANKAMALSSFAMLLDLSFLRDDPDVLDACPALSELRDVG